MTDYSGRTVRVCVTRNIRIESNIMLKFLFQSFDDFFVCILHVQSLEISNLGGEFTGVIDRASGDTVFSNDVVFDSNSEIVSTKIRGLMDDTSTGVGGDISITTDLMSIWEILDEVVEDIESSGR